MKPRLEAAVAEGKAERSVRVRPCFQRQRAQDKDTPDSRYAQWSALNSSHSMNSCAVRPQSLAQSPWPTLLAAPAPQCPPFGPEKKKLNDEHLRAGEDLEFTWCRVAVPRRSAPQRGLERSDSLLVNSDW